MIGGATADAIRDDVQARIERGGNYPKWVLLTALSGMFATSFPVTLLAVSLSTIAEDFDTSETLIAWVVSAPLLGSAVVLPVLGKLGDLYAHRRVFLTGFTVSTIVTGCTTLAWDPYSLIALRCLAGRDGRRRDDAVVDGADQQRPCPGHACQGDGLVVARRCRFAGGRLGDRGAR